MYTVTQSVAFCYGHRLLHYRGKCCHLHGHNARAVITLEGEALDERGMLCDFNDIKALVKDWIDRELDHNMLLHHDDPVLPMLQAAGERVYVMDANPTAENIARMIFEYARDQGFPVREVMIWETETANASYRP